MTQFTITGERNGATVSITWRDGKVGATVAGDAASLAAAGVVRELAKRCEGQIRDPPGLPKTSTQHLRSPYGACDIMQSIFPGKTELEGKLPPLADPPKGAIR
jgi:hypothetical protein